MTIMNKALNDTYLDSTRSEFLYISRQFKIEPERVLKV